MPHWVCILRCEDASYYVGRTKDLAGRLRAHAEGSGSAWTARRRPVTLVHAEQLADEESAFARERQIKRWTRAK